MAPQVDSYTRVIIIVAAVCCAAILISIGAVVYLIVTKSCKKEVCTDAKTDKLIPPIFYTDSITDPLKQDDLSDRIPIP